MTVVGEVQDEIRHQTLAIIALGPLAHLVSQGFLGIKLFTFIQFKVFQQLF